MNDVIVLNQLTKSYTLAKSLTKPLPNTNSLKGKNDILSVLQKISLSIPIGKVTTLVGKSGCGKTTLLRLLAGLEKPTEGTIEFPNSLSYKDVAVVFQESRLLPWMTVAENMKFAALGGVNIDSENLKYYLNLLGLTEYSDFYPQQLSGGLAQRVSLGRALCADKPIILMDEPFGALDYFTRRDLQVELQHIFEVEKKTIVFVTHDISEAVLLGDEILVLNAQVSPQKFLNTLEHEQRLDMVMAQPLVNSILEAIGGKNEKNK